MKVTLKFSATLVTLLLVLAVLVSGCGQTQSSSPAASPASPKASSSAPASSAPASSAPAPAAKLSGTIKIGVALALTGPYETGVRGHRVGIEMAVEDVNKSGLLDDAKIEIVEADAVNTNETAINAFQKLIKTDKVTAIFGPPSATQAMAAIPLAQQAKVLVMSPNALPAVPAIGDHVFGTVPMYPDTVPGALKQVVPARGIKTAALLSEKEYVLAVADAKARRETLKQLNVQIVLDEETVATDTDFTPLVTKVMNAKPDMVAVDLTPPAGPLLLKQLKQAGYKGTIMSGPGTLPPSFPAGDPQLYEGTLNIVGWFPGQPGETDKTKDFIKRFAEKRGSSPDQYAIGQYDNVWMLAKAIKKAGKINDIEGIRSALMTIEHDGLQGKLKFNDKRIQDHNPVVIQAQNGAYTLFKP